MILFLIPNKKRKKRVEPKHKLLKRSTSVTYVCQIYKLNLCEMGIKTCLYFFCNAKTFKNIFGWSTLNLKHYFLY